jgi:TonB family protein
MRSFRNGLFTLLWAIALIGSRASLAQTQDSEPIFDFEEVRKSGQKPEIYVQPAPRFPKELSRQGISGGAWVEFIIGVEGHVTQSHVTRTDDPAFGQAALEAVNQWKFRPGKMKGKPVAVRVTQLLEFNLRDSHVGSQRSSARVMRMMVPPRSEYSLRAATIALNRLGEGTSRPAITRQTTPIFPSELVRAGVAGEVELEFVVDTEGFVRNPVVIRANNPWFARPAIDVISEWRFIPAKVGDEMVNVLCRHVVKFSPDKQVRASDLWKVSKEKNHSTLPPEFQWDSPPVPVVTEFPVYPLPQLQAGRTGKVRVEYVVDANGRVETAKVLHTTAPEFAQAILAMIDGWRFAPAKKSDGSTCSAKLVAEYNFGLGGRSDVPVSEPAREILRALKKDSARIAAPKDLDSPLKPIARRAPAYPTALLQSGEAGEALIEFYVDAVGDVQLPSIVSSSARELGYAAVQAVAMWRFEPPKRGGEETIVKARITIDFSTQEKLAVN